MKTVKLLSATLLAVSLLMVASVRADPFLGDEYRARKNKVAFLSENTRIAGNIFLPPSYDERKNIRRSW